MFADKPKRKTNKRAHQRKTPRRTAADAAEVDRLAEVMWNAEQEWKWFMNPGSRLPWNRVGEESNRIRAMARAIFADRANAIRDGQRV